MPTLPFDDISAPLFTLGQAADMLGLRHSFLRRLDDHGVVTPARSTGGQRRYSRAEIDTVNRVADLMNEGLTSPASGACSLCNARSTRSSNRSRN